MHVIYLTGYRALETFVHRSTCEEPLYTANIYILRTVTVSSNSRRDGRRDEQKCNIMSLDDVKVLNSKKTIHDHTRDAQQDVETDVKPGVDEESQ
jgi:hypothetical protein